jgi:TM2 domain-containing membrane protein YozV
MSQPYPEQPQQPQQPPAALPAVPQYGVYPPVQDLRYQQPVYPQRYGVVYPQQVAAKNPGLALVASFFIPGLGSFVNGNIGMGVAIFAAYCVAWLSTMVLIGFLLVPAVWVWGMVDAYQDAKNWNTRHGILS